MKTPSFILPYFHKSKKILPWVLFITAIGINIYLRFFPAYLPQLETQAKFNTESQILNNITQNVDKLYPDYNPLIKNRFIEEAYKQETKDNKALNQKEKKEYIKLKDDFQNDKHQTYLLGLDSYQWMRYVKNILKNGHPGDKLVQGDSYDSYMLAPRGVKVVYARFFFYISAFLYQITDLVFKHIKLEGFLFYLPLFYSLILLSVLYFLIRRFFSDFTAFLSVLFIGLSRILFSRSCAGWFDYDSFTLLFPLIISWLLITSVKEGNAFKKIIFYSLSAGMFFGLYTYTWIAYWWFLIVSLAFLGYGALNNYSIANKVSHKVLNYLISGGIFIAGSIVFSFLITHINIIANTVSAVKSKIGLGQSQSLSIWPSTYYTVAELQKVNPLDLINNLYGPVIFFFSITSMLFVYIKERRTEKNDFVILMVFWAFFMFFASFKGIRFVAFLAIPLGIFFSAGVSYIIKMIQKHFALNFRRRIFHSALLTGFIIWSGHIFYSTGLKSAKGNFPLMNDKLHKAMVFLRTETPVESIVNSWWDYGNFFKAEGKRRVIFDGQSQNRPLSYWMGQVLISNDENYAMNILRMLNNSSDTLFKEVNRYINDDFRCMSLFQKVLKSNLKGAEKILEESSLSAKVQKKVINTIFLRRPGPAYFVVDGSMVSKTVAFSFLGNWSFPKLYIKRYRDLSKREVTNNLERIFGLTQKKAESFYSETLLAGNQDENSEVLSKRLGFRYDLSKGKEDDGIIYFGNGIIFNHGELKAKKFFSKEGKYRKFKEVFFFDGKTLISKSYEDSDFKEGCLIIKDGDKWKAIGLSKELGKSLFVRLYFLKGKTLKHFEPAYSDDDAGIYIYKICWERE